MPRHHRHHGHRERPIPPIPPEPPHSCRSFRFGDFADLLAMGGSGFEGRWGPFSFDFGEGGRGGWGRGRRRRRRIFEGGELRLVLLKLLADEPSHGYDLIRAIEEMTGGEYAPSPGVVYPTLNMLEDLGFIEEDEVEGSRRVYSVTQSGLAHLDEKSDEVDDLIERLKELAPQEEKLAGPAIGRAVKNLMTALSHRIGGDGLDEERLHEIAAVLDEAAQRIDRIK